MDKFLTYNHPSVPMKGIVVGRTYTLEELQEKFTLDEIKCFFKPTNFSFDELVIKETKTSK
jgi:hypothetical protein